LSWCSPGDIQRRDEKGQDSKKGKVPCLFSSAGLPESSRNTCGSEGYTLRSHCTASWKAYALGHWDWSCKGFLRYAFGSGEPSDNFAAFFGGKPFFFQNAIEHIGTTALGWDVVFAKEPVPNHSFLYQPGLVDVRTSILSCRKLLISFTLLGLHSQPFITNNYSVRFAHPTFGINLAGRFQTNFFGCSFFEKTAVLSAGRGTRNLSIRLMGFLVGH